MPPFVHTSLWRYIDKGGAISGFDSTQLSVRLLLVAFNKELLIGAIWDIHLKYNFFLLFSVLCRGICTFTKRWHYTQISSQNSDTTGRTHIS